ncbi:hypothetical protein RA280_41750, partial [Cupriavidus sp. CV2]|uniref:hypothetical protein n=1 Tax=Cupriavidus ulmosensis TaxID=3065913 RepID=UPI00296B4C64
DATTPIEQPYCSAPGRAAFFSLVFFAAQRRVTGSPRRGMSYGSWVQKPTPIKTNQSTRADEPLRPKANTDQDQPKSPRIRALAPKGQHRKASPKPFATLPPKHSG